MFKVANFIKEFSVSLSSLAQPRSDKKEIGIWKVFDNEINEETAREKEKSEHVELISEKKTNSYAVHKKDT